MTSKRQQKKRKEQQQQQAKEQQKQQQQASTVVTPAIALGKEWSTIGQQNNDNGTLTGLDPILLDIIQHQFQFSKMSPVQENSIPLLLERTNVLVQACTGSGKTLAYLVPLFHHILQFRRQFPAYWKHNYVYGIVICPTRELAKQVFSVAKIFSNDERCGVSVQLITGGGDSHLESENLLGHIAVCTPGRLLDILTSTLVFPHDWLQMLVLDEADRLLDMGFSAQLEQIIKILKRVRKSAYANAEANNKLVHGLFSATMSECLMNDLVKSVGLDKKENSVVSVQVDVQQSSKQATPIELTNYYIVCDQDERLAVVAALLRNQCRELAVGSNGKVIIYFLTCACVDYYHKMLQEILKDGGDGVGVGGATATTRIEVLDSDKNNSEHDTAMDDNGENGNDDDDDGNGSEEETGASNKVSASSDDIANDGSVKNTTSFQIYALHGQMVTKRRKLTYESFMEEPSNIADKKSLQVLLCTDVAARGLDLPNVELIIQYDAPTDPSSFVHRVGRTARMGKSGQSIVLLSKHEDNYVEYLHVKRVPVIPYPTLEAEVLFSDEYKSQFFKRMKTVALKDREILEKGAQAFITLVRAYREHQCEYIFRVRQLNFASLARAYVLTELPKKMRELKKILPAELVAAAKGITDKTKDGQQQQQKKKNQRRKTSKEKREEQKRIESIKFIWDKELCKADIEKIPYKDSRREKARMIREEKLQTTAATTESAAESSKSNRHDSLDEDDKKKSVSQQKRDIRDSKTINVKRKRAMYEKLEMDELEREAKLIKKLKSGKISKAQFEALTGEEELEAMIMAETHTTSLNKGSNFVSSIEQKKQQVTGGGSCDNNNAGAGNSSKQSKKKQNKKRRLKS